MLVMALTRKQQAIFDFLVAFQERNGRTPTGPEIAGHFGYNDPSSAYQHLRLIEKKGYLRIVREGPKTPLRITLTRKGRHAVGQHWPVLGAIPAGPLEMVLGEDEEVVARVEDLLPMIRPGDYFLYVEGDSMINAGLEEGKTVLLRPNQPPRQGDVCAVWVDGEGGTLKRVYLEGNEIRLVPENDRYEAMTYPLEQVRVQGVVIAAISIDSL